MPISGPIAAKGLGLGENRLINAKIVPANSAKSAKNPHPIKPVMAINLAHLPACCNFHCCNF